MDCNIVEVLMQRKNDAEIRSLCDTIRQTAYQVHLYFGTGFLEKVYENALRHRLEKLGLAVQQQVKMVVCDEDGFCVGHYEADLIVEKCIIVELKAVRALNTAHEAQLLNYLKTTGVHDGLLINFGSEKFEIMKRVCSTNTNTPRFILEKPSPIPPSTFPLCNSAGSAFSASAAAGKPVSSTPNL